MDRLNVKESILKELILALKKERQQNGITAVELSEHLGYTSTLVGRWECGDKRPSLFSLQTWADGLDVDITDWLHENISS